MKQWVRKSLIVLFTIATFGLITPPAVLTVNKHAPEETPTPEKEDVEAAFGEVEIADSTIEDVEISFIDQLLSEAEKQSFQKFGGKIGNVIEHEFRTFILPRMEEVISGFLETEHDRFENLAISQQPSSGKGEKIFHIFDQSTGEDVLRFHVRTDHPPLEGYWFDFHYHTYHDNFQNHYTLGRIYWDTNTPPNWMS